MRNDIARINLRRGRSNREARRIAAPVSVVTFVAVRDLDIEDMSLLHRVPSLQSS